MSLYSIALFVHVLGAVTVFVLLALEGVTLRTRMTAARLNRVLGPISALAVLVAGFYLAAQTGWHAWTAAGLVSYVFIAAAGSYTGIGVMRGRMAAPTATVSWLIRTGIAVGVLFDMTVKPEAFGSIAAVAAGIVLALAAVVPTLRTVRPT